MRREVDPKGLNESEERAVYAALRAILAGKQEEVSSYTDLVKRRYFPMKAVVYAAEDIVVTKDNPLVIEPQGHDPVIVAANSITLEPEGQIICHAPVIITANQFIKK